MARLVNAQIGEFQPDVLFADGLSMAQYVPEAYPGLKLLHEHNAEYLIWQRQSDLETGPRRWLAASEAARLRRYEAAALGRFDIVFAVSEDDRQELLALGSEPGRLRILPNIPDPALFEMPAPVVRGHSAGHPVFRHPELAAQHRGPGTPLNLNPPARARSSARSASLGGRRRRVARLGEPRGRH